MYELRVCVTLDCNFKCIYCSKDGEGIYSERKNLSNDEMVDMIERLTWIGVSSVRFTGGEPFLRKDFLTLAEAVLKLKGIKNISVVTNGSLLNDRIIDYIAKEKIFSNVTISLDTLQCEKFERITSVNAGMTVIENIKKLSSKGVNTWINLVLMKDNLMEIEQILDFCKQERVNLKVLDLYNNSDYVSTQSIGELIQEKGFVQKEMRRIPGNLGTPMQCFMQNGIYVTLKNSLEGTTYSETACSRCSRFPCQLGIVGPIMTHDGIIKVCNLGRERGINCFDIKDSHILYKIFQKTGGVEKRWKLMG